MIKLYSAAAKATLRVIPTLRLAKISPPETRLAILGQIRSGSPCPNRTTAAQKSPVAKKRSATIVENPRMLFASANPIYSHHG
ncbi:MAG: hypothetical protein HYY22_02190 [Thaumarchaeota archaeon]|nr:hypothetical protein [Nitrososphaerota archaeon]